ncbi:uncharacterized protein LOC107421979 isoform X2 [Ziziphus jujuba]|uniref:Uncharacterized protein LOC107421979 isoform X2 n=1 Tax=Ziziphus jujuba TaxID=326968 RepID=A0ABM3IRE9_ZIZJJ|nr:uncharacterized protein LOC107421979 isoform X2 [Ziziphus jujuba]
MRFSPWDIPLLSNSYTYSNFQCFLQSVTPTIHVPSKTSSTEVLNDDDDDDEDQRVGVADQDFSLNELWKLYVEWSLFGVGVPILLNNGDSVLQYYSPSLSALQFYTKKPFICSTSRVLAKQESSESWSTDDSESSSDDQISVSLSNYSSRNSDITSTSDDFIHDRLHDHEHEHDHHDHHNHDRNTVDHFGHLYCQYNETSSPHDRLPLTEKINELAENYPGLLKFQSRDLSPYSWMAIAWYPIYQIPLTKNVKGLSACFLTYHTFSSLQGPSSMAKEDEKYFKCTSLMELCDEGEKFTMKEEEGSGTSFSPFGVATYKMFGELWINSNISDEERVGSYLNAANSWLKQHKFQHHDFNFFMSRRYF